MMTSLLAALSLRRPLGLPPPLPAPLSPGPPLAPASSSRSQGLRPPLLRPLLLLLRPRTSAGVPGTLPGANECANGRLSWLGAS